MRSGFNRYLFIFLAIVLVIGGCCKDCEKCPENCPIEIPDDTVPTIVVLQPSSLQTLNFRGDEVNVNFRLDDDWALDTFWLEETWISVTGTEYQKINYVVSERVLSGTNWIEQIQYTLPTNQIQDYSTIRLCGFVRDNKGHEASKCVYINVLPEPGTTPPYEIQEYTGCQDTIYSILTGNNFNYWFLGRTNTPSSPSLYDIGEASTSPNFTAVLNTPNQPGVDSTIVMTSAAVFNYDSLTWKTTWEAFVTSNRIGAQSEPLKAGDIVIIKMITPPHYGIMRICEVFNNGQNAGIVFDYKYTWE